MMLYEEQVEPTLLNLKSTVLIREHVSALQYELSVMTLKYAKPEWRLMATVQVDADAPDLAEILADLDFDFKLVPTSSPDGVRWFNLYTDERRGSRRCALTAYRLLSALSSIAATGELPSFRIIAGQRWLQHPESEKFRALRTPMEKKRNFEVAA